ncbi:MAG: thioesterase II family protein [Gammaproteobacteria bacterium]
MSNDKRWLPWLGSNPSAALRLFCMPYAGGGASAYYPWKDALPPGVELCPVQLPGREERVAETCIADFAQLLDALAPIVGRHLDLPFLIYGHSMGAGIAFELSRRLLRDYDKTPLHLFVSAHRSPNDPYAYPSVRSVSEDQVLNVLMRFNGMPRAVLENRELLDLYLPILRADLLVCESYTNTDSRLLSCPITLFTGALDANIKLHETLGWALQTTGGFNHHILDGDHFFLKSHKKELLDIVFSYLAYEPALSPSVNSIPQPA